MKEMLTEGLSGTQSRQIISIDTPDIQKRKIKRVDARFLETDAGELKVGEIDLLVKELRRVVLALDGLGGFED
jgi:hypothetical protein